MNLKEFAILTDENISIEVVYFLRNEGFLVSSILENETLGLSDIEILNQSFLNN